MKDRTTLNGWEIAALIRFFVLLQDLLRRIHSIHVPGRHLPQLHETMKLGIELEHRLKVTAPKMDIKIQKDQYNVKLVMAS